MTRLGCVPWSPDLLKAGVEEVGIERVDGPIVEVHHPHAVRILARAWLHIIWRAWQDGADYDPTRTAPFRHS